MARARTPKDTWALMNAYNLALPDVNYRPNKRYSANMFARKVDFLSSKIGELGSPNVIVMPEVFHQQALRTVVDAVADDAYKDATIFHEDEVGNEPRVAIVSRLPEAQRIVYKEIPEPARLAWDGAISPIDSFRRPVLHLVVESLTGQKVDIIGGHLKSRLPIFEDNEDKHDPRVICKARARAVFQRVAEAAGLNYLIVEHLLTHRRPLLLMVDLNDPNDSTTAQIVMGESPFWGTPKESAEQIWNAKLWDAVDYFTKRSRNPGAAFTHTYDGWFQTLDLVAVSNHFYNPFPGKVAKMSKFRVLTDHLFDPTVGADGFVKQWSSDHGFVWLETEFIPEEVEG